MSWISEQTVAFLTALKADNSRENFQAMKPAYDADFKQPSARFAAAVADGLTAWTGTAHTAKIFRLNRDLRFSKDKTPYNTHLHIGFSPAGAGQPMWMFGLEPGQMSVGMGVFEYSGAALDEWRARVAGPDGAALAGLLETLQGRGMRLNAPDLKRVPAPYEKDHPQEALLRRKGLNAWKDFSDLWPAFGASGPDWCLEEFEVFRPVYDWMTG